MLQAVHHPIVSSEIKPQKRPVCLKSHSFVGIEDLRVRTSGSSRKTVFRQSSPVLVHLRKRLASCIRSRRKRADGPGTTNCILVHGWKPLPLSDPVSSLFSLLSLAAIYRAARWTGRISLALPPVNLVELLAASGLLEHRRKIHAAVGVIYHDDRHSSIVRSWSVDKILSQIRLKS